MDEGRAHIPAASAAYLNQGVQLTASSVRSAPASGRSSGPAFGSAPGQAGTVVQGASP
jgi:hypothetical protein